MCEGPRGWRRWIKSLEELEVELLPGVGLVVDPGNLPTDPATLLGLHFVLCSVYPTYCHVSRFLTLCV